MVNTRRSSPRHQPIPSPVEKAAEIAFDKAEEEGAATEEAAMEAKLAAANMTNKSDEIPDALPTENLITIEQPIGSQEKDKMPPLEFDSEDEMINTPQETGSINSDPTELFKEKTADPDQTISNKTMESSLVDADSNKNLKPPRDPMRPVNWRNKRPITPSVMIDNPSTPHVSVADLLTFQAEEESIYNHLSQRQH